jgi:two-component system chemotaxis response regulator CheB
MMERSPGDRIRVLVIDDSAYNRKALSEILSQNSEIDVVGTASDGKLGLQQVLLLKPHAITLDLEMPKMDGFTFLRILMSRQPTPVIVISSYSRKQNVFKALELGALDFIAKPSNIDGEQLIEIRDELIEKLLMVRNLRIDTLQRSVAPLSSARALFSEPAPALVEKGAASKSLLGVIVIGASTGGPPALQSLFQRLPPELPVCYLVAQHMPSNFTNAFAERLNRLAPLEIQEARGGELLEVGKVFISPGGQNLKLVNISGRLYTLIDDPEKDAKYIPSISDLYKSVAVAAGSKVLAIQLTGMGSDGADGIVAVKNAGGSTIAESHETAVVFGMPKEAIATGQIDHVLKLDEIPGEIERFAGSLVAATKKE